MDPGAAPEPLDDATLDRLWPAGLLERIDGAPDAAALVAPAQDGRRWLRMAAAAPLGVRAVERLATRLNERLTQRALLLQAAADGLDLGAACWLLFGSGARGEQTLATDQDNGLVFASAAPERDRPRWQAFGGRVNRVLATLGMALCSGGVMAGETACCLTADEWLQRFGHWIEHGAPADLLGASIYFDLRPLAGTAALAAPLQALLRERPAQVPRFRRQMAENALERRIGLAWHGGLAAQHDHEGHRLLDLKLNGSAVFVDAARLMALAAGSAAVGTRERLLAAGAGGGGRAPAAEVHDWLAAFDLLQGLRLQAQRDAAADPAHPNRIDVAGLSPLQRHLLVEALRIGRSLQQRLALDYLNRS